MSLLSVWFQPSLFPELEVRCGCRLEGMEDSERDRRTGGQWLRSINSYLEFMAGSAWRRSEDRFSSPDRKYYIDGIRLLNGIGREPMYAASLQVVLPRTVLDIHLSALAGNGRAWLVDALMRVNPSLTSRKLLMGLANLKLARMLTAAQAAVQPQARVA